MNILVTGGSSGVGKAIVLALAKDQNNKVFFTYNRNKLAADNVCSKFGDRVIAVKCDFCDSADIDSLCQKIPTFCLDALVNNAYAGVAQGTHFHKTNANDFAESFMRNILPTIRITQVAISEFRKKKSGRIVNVLTSFLIGVPPTGFSLYTSNKAYLQQLSRCWAVENSRFGITSNCISPDFMPTQFSEGVDERIIEQMTATHPLKKLLQPEETASVVEFLLLASPQVNGVTIPINAAKNL